MAAIEITTTTQDITGDFDLSVTGLSSTSVQLLKALGAGGTEFERAKTLNENGQFFVKNTGTNAYKKSANVGTVKFSQ